MNVNAGSQSSSASGRADEATLQLLDELKALASDVLGRGIERMFDGADDMLFEMARRATNNKDQRVYFDTMRVVRLGRPKIGKIFRDEIAAGFAPAGADSGHKPADFSYENLSLQESKALEESIAVSSMATKAEGLYSTLLFELSRRFDWLVREKHAPLATDCLSPSTISAAFRRSAEALDVEFDVELVIFKLFDRLVISELGELYTRALRFLDQKEVKAAAIGGGAPGAAPPPGGYGGAAPVGAAMPAVGGYATAGGAGLPATVPASYAYPAPPMMDASTLEALRNLGSATGLAPAAMPGTTAVYYGDAHLGRDLATAATGQMVAGWEQPRAYAYVQRAGAVGKMFNDMMQDPSLPAPLKPRFDQLRFAVIKSALADASFFADRKHPVRNLMSELTTLAASARASGMDALRRIEELVGQIQGQFDVAADEVRSQAALPGPVDEQTLEQFFAQQKEEARQRRQAIIDKTRRIVAEELQLQTLSRRLPDGIWPLLNSGWAPMMALRLLRQGADSEGWREGMELLRRLLDTADPRKPAARAEEACETLATELTAQLREIGMLDERIELLLRSWRQAIDQVEAQALARPAVAAAAPAVSVLDEIVFNIGSQAAGEAVPAVPAVAVVADADDTATAADPAAAPAETPAQADSAETPQVAVPDAVTLLDLLMVLSSWFRVYDHDRGQNRWLKVVGHHPADGTVSFAEFNGQNRLQMRAQVFLDDLVEGRAEPIDLGPAARRSLDAYLAARRGSAAAAQAA
ncbi:DUF1631 family protein [Panacagrimonas sp.]|uniref:DUF1631 family protein n=1 Tax=Panacagrimonas sp. TaxID=2480088 RepID=UPI003B527E5F